MSELPLLYIRGTGTVPCREDFLGICLELALFAPSQYENYNFRSMCKFGDVYIGCNEYGIFELDGDNDNNTDIDAFVEWPLTDFGVPNQKRIRKIYTGYEASGSLVFVVKNEEDNKREVTVDAALGSQVQHSAKSPVGRDGKGRYWSLELRNVGGCDFSLDSIEAAIVVLARKSGRTEFNRGRAILPAVEVYGSGS